MTEFGVEKGKTEITGELIEEIAGEVAARATERAQKNSRRTEAPRRARGIPRGLLHAFPRASGSGALNEAFLMLGEYARQHVLLCLVPAMFIAGAITVFLDQQR